MIYGSYKICEIAQVWKISKITPLAKSNNLGALTDYQPISILSAISKALEVIIRRQIMNHVDNKGLLSRCRSGFRQNHSTSMALLKITNDLLIASESKL
jgi:NADH:ubiquinone oxidoreductase subunit F (NADH-binding)